MTLSRTFAAALPAAALPAAVLLATGALFTAPPLRAQSPPPDGTTAVWLNTQQILQEAPGSAEAQRAFNQEVQELQAEVRELATVVDSLRQEYRSQEVVLSPQAKEEMQAHIEDRQEELARRAEEVNEELASRQRELLQPILDEVGDAIEAIRSEHGYSVVFDQAAEGLVAADPGLEITDLVLARLRGDGATGTGGEGEDGGDAADSDS